MALNIESDFDETDFRILQELQADARVTISELGRRVHLSQPAVKERIRRLTEAGVIRGYHADIDMHALGYPIKAIIRVAVNGAMTRRFNEIADDMPEIAELNSVTGTDAYVLKVHARSISHLDALIGRISSAGESTTYIVLQEVLRPLLIEKA